MDAQVMIGEQTQEMITRIKSIDWSGRTVIKENSAYGSKLMEEYLRRMLLWSTELKAVGWPFFSIADCITTFNDEMISNLHTQLNQVQFPNTLIKMTCFWAVQWSYLKDTSQAKQFELPDPYDPLVAMYERGACFSREQNMVTVWDIAGNMNVIFLSRDMYNRLDPFIDLNIDTVDKTDADTISNKTVPKSDKES
jgi:hypothetical protein